MFYESTLEKKQEVPTKNFVMQAWEHFCFHYIFCQVYKIKKLLCYTAVCLLLLKAMSDLKVGGGSWVKLFIMTEIIIFIHETEAQMPFRNATWEMFPSDKERNKMCPMSYSWGLIFQHLQKSAQCWQMSD
jgi:hypothetical protein